MTPGTEATGQRRFLVALALLVVVAGAVRIVNVTTWRPTCTEDFLAVAAAAERGDAVERPGDDCHQVVDDALYHHLQGRLLAEGEGYVDGTLWFFGTLAGNDPSPRPSAGDPPLFAAVLGALSALGLEQVTEQRIAMGVLGALGVGVMGLAGRRIAGPRAGLVAAGLAALYPMLWINDGMLLSEALYAPLAAWVVLAAYRWWDRPTTWRAVVLGAAVALATLTRAEAMALLAFLVLPLAWAVRKRWDLRPALTGAAAICAVVVVSLAPWLAYNAARFEHPVLMTSGTGAVLSAGSCDATYGGDLIGYYANCFDEYVATGRVDGWPDPVALDESERDLVSREGALSYIGDNLGRLPVVVAARVGRMWDVYRPEQNTRLNWQIEGRGRLASEVGVWMYAALVVPAIAGAVLVRRRGLPLSPLLAFPAAVTLTAALTFGVTRYRVPADVCLVLAAAVALDALAARRSPGAWSRPDVEADIEADVEADTAVDPVVDSVVDTVVDRASAAEATR